VPVGENDVRTITIALLDGARAIHWSGPDFDALADEIAVGFRAQPDDDMDANEYMAEQDLFLRSKCQR